MCSVGSQLPRDSLDCPDYTFLYFRTNKVCTRLTFLVKCREKLFLQILSPCLIFHQNRMFIFAKLSPNFSFNWTEMLYIVDFPHPPRKVEKSYVQSYNCKLIPQESLNNQHDSLSRLFPVTAKNHHDEEYLSFL